MAQVVSGLSILLKSTPVWFYYAQRVDDAAGFWFGLEKPQNAVTL